jgi:hypothetical protein
MPICQRVHTAVKLSSSLGIFIYINIIATLLLHLSVVITEAGVGLSTRVDHMAIQLIGTIHNNDSGCSIDQHVRALLQRGRILPY